VDAGLPVKAFFTDRHGGVSSKPYESLNLATHVGDEDSAVDINRGTVEELVGAPVVFMRPEHGINVARLDESYLDGHEPPVADVLITTVKGLGLAALGADCLPLLAHDASTGAVVAAHIGREGLRRGVVDAVVAAIVDTRDRWAHPEQVAFSIGPCICGKCYEVSATVRDEVALRHPLALSTTSWGTAAVDIPRAVEGRLGQLGFGQVVRHEYCTFEELRLFSHRREGTTGRQAGVIVCEGPTA
jgi:polyphenol oxidase